MENESININRVNKPVDKEEFITALTETTEGKYKGLFEGIAKTITGKIDSQNELIEDQNEKIGGQNKLINKLSEQIEEIKQQNNRTFMDKIKDYFK